MPVRGQTNPTSWTTQDPAWQPEEDSSERQHGRFVQLEDLRDTRSITP